MNVRQAMQGKYFKSADFAVDEERVYTVGDVRSEAFPLRDGQEGETEQKIVLYTEESEQGLVLNQTTIQSLARSLGDQMTADETSEETWVGKQFTLYRMEDVKNPSGIGPALRVRKAA